MAYDSIVVGLGGMGSAAAAHLAQRGQRVIGFEQFGAAHDRGSSHGKTRIIRQAYFEDSAYVPLLLRAYELWHDLEQQTGQTLYVPTGGLFVGLPHSPLVVGSQRSAREHNLAHEVLDATAIHQRFPATRPRAQEVGVFELPAGMLFPERCVQAYLDRAAHLGAVLRFGTKIAEWGTTPSGAAFVTTVEGQRHEAGTLVLCIGAWWENARLSTSLPIRIERNVMHWFEPAAAARQQLSKLPVFIVDREANAALYGFPYIPGQGLKAGFHHTGNFTHADSLEREVAAQEIQDVSAAVLEWLPAAGRHVAAVVCMYELSPDEHFIVGAHPDSPQIIVAGGFSGHGFKFCSVIGEIVADLATSRSTHHSIGLFSPQRFAAR